MHNNSEMLAPRVEGPEASQINEVDSFEGLAGVTQSRRVAGAVSSARRAAFIPIDVGLVRRRLSYNPQTGTIRWREKPSAGRVRDDLIAGTVSKNRVGLMRWIIIGGKKYTAGRVAWALHYGEDPADLNVIFWNHDQLDTRIANLALATTSQMMMHKRGDSTTETGLKGISYYKRKNAWAARIRVNGRDVFLGYHPTAEAAHSAYSKAAAKHFGVYAHV